MSPSAHRQVDQFIKQNPSNETHQTQWISDMFYLKGKVLEKRNQQFDGNYRYYIDCLIYDRGRPEVISVRIPEPLVKQWHEFEANQVYQMPVSLYPRDNRVYVSLADDSNNPVEQ